MSDHSYHSSIILFLTMALLFVSCNSNKQAGEKEMPALYPPPVAIKLNTEEGYIINPVTGDSIQALINSLGDTIITGVPVPVKGKMIHPDSVGQAVIIPAGKPQAVPISRCVFKIPEYLTIIPVDKDTFRTFTPGVDKPSNVWVNPSGDTIPTGIPIPTKGKLVRCVQPQPVNALPPLMSISARINIKYLNEAQGMPASDVRSILEDRQGNLWFGTMDLGVIKYNGINFMNFTEREGLCNNWVSSIIEDSYGNIWVGTLGGGVCMYNGDNFTHFSHGEGLINTNILCMMTDSQDNIWFGTEGGGAAKYNGNTITHFTTKEGLPNNNVLSIIEDKQGNIWFGTDRGASKYDGEIFTPIDNREGLRNTITSILEDRQGNIWFGTDRGAYKYDGEVFIHFYEKVGFTIDPVKTIFEDSHGNLWFGTVGAGLIIYSGETFTQISTSDNHVNSILEDSQGNMWIGSNTGGVSVYSNIPFTYLRYKEGLGSNYVASITEDRQGNLWFGTGWRLSKYNEESFTNFDTIHGLSDNWIYSTLEDSQGNLWLGTRNGGVNKFNGETFTHYTEKEGLSNNRVYSIVEDSNGNFWFGTEGGGVSMYNGDTFTHYTEKEGLSNNDIRSVAEDSQGNLWFGSYGSGVCKYNGETIIHITEKEGLGSNFIHCIFEDSYGNLWFGTEGGGASIFNGETFIHITEKEGLSNNCAWSIMEDNNRNIWVGTKKGLNYFDIGSRNVFRTAWGLYTSEDEKDDSKGEIYQPVIHTYDLQDGLKDRRIVERTMYLDSKNRIWMANGGAGLITLDMSNFKTPVDPPKMQLDWIEINWQFADYRQLKDSPGIEYEFTDVAMYHNYPLNLELPYHNNHLTFHFSAIDWTAPHKLRYSYKMDGLDKEWSKPSPEAKADYRSLPFGKYTFKVRSIGAAQKWSDAFEYPFTIHPPWWFRWWAIVAEVLFLSFLLLVFIKYRERNLKNRAALLEQKVDDKTHEILEQRKEVDKLKSRFYANISHEFRTPLTLLVGPLEDSVKAPKEDVVMRKGILRIMLRNARRLQRLINQLLDISKLESGNLQLQLVKGDLSDFVKAISGSFHSLADSNHINYNIEVEEAPDEVCFDADKTEKVIINLLSNAFKFTLEGGSVNLKLHYQNSSDDPEILEVVIEIKDTGKGIGEDQLGRIFERFYQVSDSDTREVEGTGIGLALTSEMIDLMHGMIDVESKLGVGTKFRVAFPVSEPCFPESEISTFQLSETILSELDISEEDRMIGKENEAIDKKRKLILVVEDNADLRNYIRDQLESLFRIEEAKNGKAGLEKAQKILPDLVITDLMMPVMGGTEMCEKLKNHPATNHIPVIMLTAKADKESKLKGLETGADDYIIKPFDAEELTVRSRNLIQQRERLWERFQSKYLLDDHIAESSGQFKMLRELISVIDRHIEDPEFDLKIFGEELNLSRSQLFRKIHNITGNTPNELTRMVRMKRAARLIRAGGLNVTQVMYSVGMKNPSYFASSFKKYYGVNPSKFGNA